MKRQVSFWLSLERYTWKLIDITAPALPYVVIASVGLVIVASVVSQKYSLAGAGGLREASLRAAGVGDYTTAQYLFKLHKSQIPNSQTVLGAESEGEDVVFPEKVIEREIERYQEWLLKYPGHRDIYLVLAELYTRSGEAEKAQMYESLARQLDPNNAALKARNTNPLP